MHSIYISSLCADSMKQYQEIHIELIVNILIDVVIVNIEN